MKINLGSGGKNIDGYVNIDNRQEVSPDITLDVLKGLPYEDNSVDEVRAYDFLEHIPIGKTVGVVEDIYRVLKPGGLFGHHTPSTDGRGAFQDPTHVSFWNINSWLYYTADNARNLYGIKAKFRIEELKDIDTGYGVIHTLGRMYAVK